MINTKRGASSGHHTYQDLFNELTHIVMLGLSDLIIGSFNFFGLYAIALQMGISPFWCILPFFDATKRTE